jgi:radical SAM protein with 4Fe4S-binding SPASM domain
MSNIVKIKDKKEIESNQYRYDHMVYIRLFEGCNLNCEHCFIPSNPKKIDLNFYKNENITKILKENANIQEGNILYLQWHGGEPTLLGVDYLKTAIEEIEKDHKYYYQHGIQTNLMNFHENMEKWIDLYHEYFHSEIGVSWDYQIRHVKRKDVNSQTNQEYENIFWRNLNLAQKNHLKIYLVITVTKLFFEHFKNPFDFFEMMEEKKIEKLNFERITKTGLARETWDKLGLNNLEYSENMSKFYKAYKIYKKSNPKSLLQISPFDGLENAVKSMNVEKEATIWDILSYKNQGYGCWSGECDTKFHTIDSHGYKHGCTALTSEQDNKNKIVQNIPLEKIIWIGKNQNQQKMNILDARKHRQETCQNCEFLKICSSGCLTVEKFDDSGECSGAKRLFLTIQQFSKKEHE